MALGTETALTPGGSGRQGRAGQRGRRRPRAGDPLLLPDRGRLTSSGTTLGKRRTLTTRKSAARPLAGRDAEPDQARQRQPRWPGTLTVGNAGRRIVLQSNPWLYTQGFRNATNELLTNATGGASRLRCCRCRSTRSTAWSMPELPHGRQPGRDRGREVLRQDQGLQEARAARAGRPTFGQGSPPPSRARTSRSRRSATAAGSRSTGRSSAAAAGTRSASRSAAAAPTACGRASWTRSTHPTTAARSTSARSAEAVPRPLAEGARRRWAGRPEVVIVDVAFEERYWYPDDGAIWLAGFQPVDPVRAATWPATLRCRPRPARQLGWPARCPPRRRPGRRRVHAGPAAEAGPRAGQPARPNAISVDAAGDRQAGWVPRELAAVLAPAIDAGEPYSRSRCASVERTRGRRAPGSRYCWPPRRRSSCASAQVRLVTWNVAGRVRRLPEQAAGSPPRRRRRRPAGGDRAHAAAVARGARGRRARRVRDALDGAAPAAPAACSAC